MELKYIVLTIIKILISVPAILLVAPLGVSGAALMGGHLDNKSSNATALLNLTSSYYDFDLDNDSLEAIPNPSALVVPGYNLPENIFNKGKPFYLEKDPLTGVVDFENRSPDLKVYDEYDYVEDDVYDKANIDRKDGSLSSHKASDVNQLTPNLYDFLNLPLKYNSDKYVYPLVSSSYANTKVQGNVNKHYNHKDYSVVTTKTPTYFPTKSGGYFHKTESTTTTPKATSATRIRSTTEEVNLTDGGTSHPNFSPSKPKIDDIYLTTTTTTTERVMSLLEQFIAGFDEPISTTTKKSEDVNGHAGPYQNVLTGTNMGQQNTYDYDYEEDVTDNIAVENQVHVVTATVSGVGENQYKKDEGAPSSSPVYDDYIELTTGTTTATTTQKVTSLPLGENHVSYSSSPIIVATQNLREQLNNEKVDPKPFGFDKATVLHPVPSTSNIHIAPDQDTVSFVVGNHQNVDGQYIGSALKESPYDSNPFRPLYEENVSPPQQIYDVVKIQPIRNSEASLAIGVPVDVVKGKPGQVVDESSEINNEKIEFPKGNGPKIVFPDEKILQVLRQPNREVLKLNSQPMFHQLPSDLTPPSESGMPVRRERPPWDPRPGHFHAGRPEYARPPRPNQNDAFKRIDSLPNILPQFRPNVRPPNINKEYMRQPLLDRPSNRPIGFFEKLHPPPPPPPKLLHNFRKVPQVEQELTYRGAADDRVMTAFYQGPPKMVLAATRRNGDDDVEVETLQMLQAKLDKKDKNKVEVPSSFHANPNNEKDGTEKPIYVVYPVKTPPLKLDVIDANKKETVVIGTRAELPLPPSKIKQDDDEEKTYDEADRDILSVNPRISNPYEFRRHDSPVLKPQHHNYLVKSEFPYPLERPDPTLAVEMTGDDRKFQWNSLDDGTESRIVSGSKINTQISVKLKTYTEKPIAVAYTPTESHKTYSMPDHASPVIPEIRPENFGAAQEKVETTHVPQLDFQAPFQASLNVDNVSHGWSVIKDKPKGDGEKDETTTTMTLPSTSEFDIENFKPQLIGGFKPIYDFPDSDARKDAEVNERGE